MVMAETNSGSLGHNYNLERDEGGHMLLQTLDEYSSLGRGKWAFVWEKVDFKM